MISATTTPKIKIPPVGSSIPAKLGRCGLRLYPVKNELLNFLCVLEAVWHTIRTVQLSRPLWRKLPRRFSLQLSVSNLTCLTEGKTSQAVQRLFSTEEIFSSWERLFCFLSTECPSVGRGVRI